MEAYPQSEVNKKRRRVQTILLSGLLVATLDGSAAVIQTIAYGRNPVGLFNYIASAIYGQDAFAGGLRYTFYGLLFHYCITFSWTLFFFWIYPKMKFLSRNRMLTGIGYGLFIWLIMNRVVVPMSNVSVFPFRIASAIIGATILIVAIGVPLSFIAFKFYSSDYKR